MAKPESVQRNRQRAKNRKHYNDYMRKYRKGQRDAHPKRYKENQRGYRLRSQYGLSRDDYAEMLRAQGGKCASCRRPETQQHASGRVQELSVDHNHETSAVRGLLCSRCNRALGYLGDDVLRVQALLAYIERYT